MKIDKYICVCIDIYYMLTYLFIFIYAHISECMYVLPGVSVENDVSLSPFRTLADTDPAAELLFRNLN